MLLKIYKNLSIIFISCLLLLIYIPLLNAQEKNEDIIVKAMSDELKRNMENLRMEKLEKPYYIDYTIIDEEELTIQASFGGIKRSNRDNGRSLKVNVKIGDYKFDNSNFLSINSLYESGQSYGVKTLTVENDYNAIRRSIWLATDEAYKSGLENLSRKSSYIKNITQNDQIDSYSKITAPVEIYSPDIKMNWDEAYWKKSCTELSNIFKKFPRINKSEVIFSIVSQKIYFTSSEGTKRIEPRALVSMEVYASTQAPDGMMLNDLISYSRITPDQLPKLSEIIQKTEVMAKELSDLSESSILDEYIGPVIFEGQAAAEFFRQMLGKNLCGIAPLLMDDQRYASYYSVKESEFKGRIGSRILPDFLDVWADPQINEYEGRQLIGYYKTDDEGVTGKKVQLVEKGVLKNFLTSRTPIKYFNSSNGHGRRYSLYDKTEAKISNLFIKATQTKTIEEMKKQLIDLCRQQNKEYGLIIRKLSNEKSDRTQSGYVYNDDRNKKSILTAPLAVYKILPDGTEKIVRGIEFTNIIVRILKDIISASNDYYCYDWAASDSRYGSSEPPIIGCSIIAPSILLEEIETKKVSDVQKKSPLLKHPYFK